MVWFQPELRRSPIIKRLLMPPPFWVGGFPYREHPDSEMKAIMLLGQDARPDEPLTIRCTAVLAMHKVLGPIGPEGGAHV